VIYTATITSTPLRLRETRIVADLLLQGLDEAAWKDAIVEQNVLQVDSPIGVIRSANILRARLKPLGEGLWKMVCDGDREVATQAALGGAIKHSRLLGDFLDLTVREQRALFATKLEPRMWTDYIAGCRGRDPDMPHWSDSTVNKLRSIVFSILAEADYLTDTRNLTLQNVFVDLGLANYLRDCNELYVLRCLEVME
jgi:hypothetical protein